MLYGLIIDFGQTFCNYGDLIQSVAIERIYQKMNIPPEQIVRLTKKDLSSYDGEPILLPFSYTIYYLINFETGELALSDRIIPIFLGVSIESIMIYNCILPEDFAATGSKWMGIFRKNAPVGCRDHFTLRFMKEHGIAAYLQGCITNTLPRREKGDYNKTLLIDCPQSILPHIPPELLTNAEVMSNVAPMGSCSVEDNYQRVMARYEYYKNNAAFVVTSRYHVALPCNAMGIPSVIVKPQVSKYSEDVRWDALPPQVQMCASERDYWNVRWHSEYEDFPEFKETILKIASARIMEAFIRHDAEKTVSVFFAPQFDVYNKTREQHESYADLLRAYLQRHHAQGQGRFYIWGAMDIFCRRDRVELSEIIFEINPDLEFAGWIDSFRTGTLANKKIEKISDVILGKDDFIVVAAESATHYASSYFAGMGLNERNYLLLGNRTLVLDIEK